MPFITEGKTNLKYILIIVLLAAIVGGGILAWQYLLVPKEEPKMPEVKPPEVKIPEEIIPPGEVPPKEEVEVVPGETPPGDETANWQEFTNGSFRYSIRYPTGWRYFDCSTAAQYGDPCFLSNDYISSGGDPIDMIVSGDQVLGLMLQGMRLSIVSVETEPGQIMSCGLFVLPEEKEICEDIQVGSLPAAKLTSREVVQIGIDGGEETFVEIVVNITQDTNLHMIFFSYLECERKVNPDGSTFRDCSNIDEVPVLLDQILSTFWFLE